MLPEKLFFLDIETTGATKRDEILEIAILEVNFDARTRTYLPRRRYERVLQNAKQPVSDFAKKHQQKLYDLANATEYAYPEDIRNEIVEFLKTCDAMGKRVFFAGRNAEGFDLQALSRYGMLVPPETRTLPDGSQQFVGDYHYRVFNVGSVEQFAALCHGAGTRDELYQRAGLVEAKDAEAHRAMPDNERELARLNALIKLFGKAPVGDDEGDLIKVEEDETTTIMSGVYKPSKSSPSKKPTS